MEQRFSGDIENNVKNKNFFPMIFILYYYQLTKNYNSIL